LIFEKGQVIFNIGTAPIKPIKTIYLEYVLNFTDLSMNKREIVRMVYEGKHPPYVPWHFTFTKEAWEKLAAHFSEENVESILNNHYLKLGSDVGFYVEIGNNRFRDVFGVIWDRTIDKDIGTPEGFVLPEPTLDGYEFPDPLDKRFFQDIQEQIEQHSDRFRIYFLGFTLFERAWTLRGMENLMTDFKVNPDFAHTLLTTIADYNITQTLEALKYDIDCVRFGDDWGQQYGLIMGPECWKEFIYPQIKRMYEIVRNAGKYVLIHCCGDVDELFDDLIDIGINCFNPFQPEVMDVWTLLPKYRGRLSFYGGLSLQQTLAFGTERDVREESRRLLQLGAETGYIFSPSHDVVGDVPLENMLAFIEEAQSQPGYIALKNQGSIY